MSEHDPSKIDLFPLIGMVGLLGMVALCAYGDSGEETEDEPIEPKYACQVAVEQRLVAPDSAEFIGSETDRDGDYADVRGEVLSKNRMGVKVRSMFTCDLHLSAGNWDVQDVTVDDGV